MKILLCAGGVALVMVGAVNAAGGDQGPSPQDKAALQQLTANYLAQMSALDGMNKAYATYKFGNQMYQEGVPGLPGGDDTIATTVWNALPTFDMAAATASAKSALNNVTADQVAGFMTSQCAQQAGVGQKLGVLNQKLQLGMPADVGQQFEAVRDQVCRVVEALGNLKVRYDKYQSIKTNGITLMQRYKHTRKGFDGHTRHIAGRMSLVWFPDIAATIETGNVSDPNIAFNTYMKYSDQNEKPLNIRQRLSSLKQNQPDCKGFPIPLDSTMTLKIQVKDANAQSATIEACLRFHFIGDTEEIGLGSMTVPAPFGYLAELESMKDGAKQQLANQLVNQITGMFNTDQLGNITKLYSLIEKMQGAQ